MAMDVCNPPSTSSSRKGRKQGRPPAEGSKLLTDFYLDVATLPSSLQIQRLLKQLVLINAHWDYDKVYAWFTRRRHYEKKKKADEEKKQQRSSDQVLSPPPRQLVTRRVPIVQGICDSHRKFLAGICSKIPLHTTARRLCTAQAILLGWDATSVGQWVDEYYEVHSSSRIDSPVSKDIHTLQVPLDPSVSNPIFTRREMSEPACSFIPWPVPDDIALREASKWSWEVPKSFPMSRDEFNAKAEPLMVRMEEFLVNVAGVEGSSC